MDLFDLSQIFNFWKSDPSHGLLQSLILLGIWATARGVQKQLVVLGHRLDEINNQNEKRFEKIEVRLTFLETKEG